MARTKKATQAEQALEAAQAAAEYAAELADDAQAAVEAEAKAKAEKKAAAQAKAQAKRKKARESVRGYLEDNLVGRIKSRHKAKHGTECTLTIDDLMTMYYQQKGKCYWTGLPLQWGDQLADAHPMKISFDQLEPGAGYTKENVVLASNFANRARGNTPVAEFREILELLKHTMQP